MTTDTLRLSGVFRYPVKSLGGHALGHATVEPRGIAGDRRWMLVDPGGRFVTRRELPNMARVNVASDGDGLVLHHPNLGSHRVARPDDAAPLIEVVVWRDRLMARIADAQAGAFLTAALGRPVRLVHQPDASMRAVDPRYADAADHVSLADGFPILVTSEASLAALNAHLPAAIGMARFRPNLVIAGSDAWDEDRWRRIRIGTVTLRLVKPCSRCIIVTQDPATGLRARGNEPLTQLRAMARMTKAGVMFGQNALPDGPGALRIGDAVEILEAGESNVV